MILPSINELKEQNEKFENGAQFLTKESFSFHSQIGSGAFGKVFRVSSKLTGEIYALKVLSKKQITNLNLIEQLKKEISIIASCNHENIIKLYGAFEDKSYIYLIMELATGSTLFNKLKKVTRMPEAQAARYLADIVSALIYLHSQKPVIIHRDLKPENILLCENRCKIADFGWSNVIDEFRNTFCGTPDYLAPEMIIGTGHDEKLDVWTVGVMLFELIEGQPPFSAKEKVDDARVQQKMIEKNILSGKIEFNKEMSEDARNAIRILLNPKAEFRPTASEILELKFFKKHLSENGVQETSKEVAKSVSESLDPSSLRAKLGEYKEKCFSMQKTIQRLSELVQEKEASIRTLKRENESVSKNQEKLATELSQLRNSGHKSEEQRQVGELMDQNKGLADEVSRQDEIIGYVFRRITQVSEAVSLFYQTNVIGAEKGSMKPSKITFENAILKLEHVFKEFVKYKQAVFSQKLILDTNCMQTEDYANDLQSSDNQNQHFPVKLRAFSPFISKQSNNSFKIEGSSDGKSSEFQSKLEEFFKKSESDN